MSVVLTLTKIIIINVETALVFPRNLINFKMGLNDRKHADR